MIPEGLSVWVCFVNFSCTTVWINWESVILLRKMTTSLLASLYQFLLSLEVPFVYLYVMIYRLFSSRNFLNNLFMFRLNFYSVIIFLHSFLWTQKWSLQGSFFLCVRFQNIVNIASFMLKTSYIFSLIFQCTTFVEKLKIVAAFIITGTLIFRTDQ